VGGFLEEKLVPNEGIGGEKSGDVELNNSVNRARAKILYPTKLLRNISVHPRIEWGGEVMGCKSETQHGL